MHPVQKYERSTSTVLEQSMKGYCECEQYVSKLINYASQQINPKFKSQRLKPASKTLSQNPYPKSNLVKHDMQYVSTVCREKRIKLVFLSHRLHSSAHIGLLSRVFQEIKDPRNKVDSSFGSLTCWPCRLCTPRLLF